MKLQQRQQELEAKPAPSTKEKRGPLAPQEIDQLCIRIETLLRDWSYPNLQRVTFEADSLDLIISGQLRVTQGKGYRAVSYAGYMIGLMQYCVELKRSHPGFVVLDSPLVTYRKRDKRQVPAGEEINDDIVPAFYRSLSKLVGDQQVIVLENEEPPEDLLESIFYTHFTGNNFDRYGLLSVEDGLEAGGSLRNDGNNELGASK